MESESQFNTRPADHGATPPTSPLSSQQQGIDIRQALEILEARNSQGDLHDHCHHLPSAGCNVNVPEEAKSMGQTIDLNAPSATDESKSDLHEQKSEEDQAQAIAEDMEEKRKQLQEARKQREEEIRAELETMSVRELLSAVMESQSERVATYKEYDR